MRKREKDDAREFIMSKCYSFYFIGVWIEREPGISVFYRSNFASVGIKARTSYKVYSIRRYIILVVDILISPH
jgi:hypothetical protein